MTTIAFTPNQLTGFAFQPTLEDSTGALETYNAYVKWNTMEQRWYLSVENSDGVIQINTPLVESPDNKDFNLIAASTLTFFTSTIVFRDSTGMFEINP